METMGSKPRIQATKFPFLKDHFHSSMQEVGRRRQGDQLGDNSGEFQKRRHKDLSCVSQGSLDNAVERRTGRWWEPREPGWEGGGRGVGGRPRDLAFSLRPLRPVLGHVSYHQVTRSH